MWHRIETTSIATTVLAAGLLVAAGCTGTSGEGEAGESLQQRSDTLLSVETNREGAETVELEFGHSPDEGWSLESVGLEDGERFGVRRQAQNGSGGSSGQSGSESRFSGASPATVRFFGGGGQSSRFRGTADSTSRFSAGSDARTRFDLNSGLSAGGVCDPVALCDFAETVCQVYVGAEGTGGVTEDCSSSAMQQCRSEMRQAAAASTGTFESGLVCFFSLIARCATQGIESAGTISSEEQLNEAAMRGLRNCTVDGIEDLEFSTGESDSEQQPDQPDDRPTAEPPDAGISATSDVGF